MNRRQKAKLEWMAWGTLYSFLFPFFFMWLGFKVPIWLALPAAASIAVIGGPGVSGMLFFFVPYSRRFPFIVALLLQIVGFFAIGGAGFFVSSLIIGSLAERRSPFDPELVAGVIEGLQSNPQLRVAYVVTFSVGVFMLGWNQVSSKLGGSAVTWGWITGRYHRPRIEEKLFMFLDIKDSTPLAESLGDLKFSALVQRFFRDMGQLLETTGGRVSHFIGDEAVIYWKPRAGLKAANCIRFFEELEAEIAHHANSYREAFGVVPEFKAGLHMGKVVATEVGYGKTEIVYHGDVLNTTARIVGKCAELGHDLLISKEVADALKATGSDRALNSLGAFELKGKAEKVEIYAPSLADS